MDLKIPKPAPSLSLMLSLSKHEEDTQPFSPIPRAVGGRGWAWRIDAADANAIIIYSPKPSPGSRGSMRISRESSTPAQRWATTRR
jgi:hypothetical protein